MRRVKRAPDDPTRFEYGPDVCPPLVSAEVFAAAQQRLVENRALASRRLSFADKVLLRNPLGVCGHCGGALATLYDKRRGEHFYRCSSRIRPGSGEKRGECTTDDLNSIKAETLDTACWDWFVDNLSHPERLREQYEVYLANREQAQWADTSERAAVEAARTQALDQEQSYFAAVGNAKSDEMRACFVQLAEEAHERYSTLTQSLENLIATDAERREQAQIIKSFQDAAPLALKKLAGASLKEKRVILYRFEVRAILYGRRHEPAYQFRWVFDTDVFCSNPRVGARERGRGNDRHHLSRAG